MKSRQILIFLAFSFAVLGALKLLNIVLVPSIAYLGYGISAVLFVSTELLDKLKNRINFNKRYFSIIKFILNLLAIIAIMITPFIKTDKDFGALTFAISLFTFSLLFIIMAFDDIVCLTSNIDNTLKNKKAADEPAELSKSLNIDKTSLSNQSDNMTKENQENNKSTIISDDKQIVKKLLFPSDNKMKSIDKLPSQKQQSNENNPQKNL
jgi:hypothetical protein